LPRKRDHLDKAGGNERFAQALDLGASPNVDWAITALFYAALHYVEAYFATTNWHSVDHRARDSAIQRDNKLKVIFDDYSELKNYSINARYFIAGFKPTDVKTLEPHLQNIKTHIVSLIGT
jgi:hypothetical protein